nr:histone H2A variant 1 [Tanacetum cinerariifolium]
MTGKGGKGLLAGKTTTAAVAANKDKDKKRPMSRSSRAGLQAYTPTSFRVMFPGNGSSSVLSLGDPKRINTPVLKNGVVLKAEVVAIDEKDPPRRVSFSEARFMPWSKTKAHAFVPPFMWLPGWFIWRLDKNKLGLFKCERRIRRASSSEGEFQSFGVFEVGKKPNHGVARLIDFGNEIGCFDDDIIGCGHGDVVGFGVGDVIVGLNFSEGGLGSEFL